MSEPPIRIVVRSMNDFQVRTAIAHARLHDGDMVTSFVFETIASANIAHIPYQSDEARLVLPGEPERGLRRAVSAFSVSQSLGLPYETVRSRAARLIEVGYCERAAKGLVVPAAILATEPFQTAVEEVYAGFIEVMRDMVAIGFDFSTGAEAPARVAPPPRALVVRMAVDFQLRTMESFVPTYGDVMHGFIWSGILRANVRRLTRMRDKAWEFATQDSPPTDELRDPITIRAIARELNLPFETVRRHVSAMVEQGWLKSTPKGVFAPAAAVGNGGLGRNNLTQMRHFTRMVADLQKLGFDFSQLA